MISRIGSQITRELEVLPEALQQQVLDYVHALLMSTSKGGTGRQLGSSAGSIPPDDLILMQQAIDDACERVDQNRE